MAFSNKLSARQTAVKAATDVVVAKIGAGMIEDASIEGEITALTEMLYTDLISELDLDTVPATPKFDSRSNVGNGSSYETTGDQAPGEYKYTWGKNAGKTVAEVEAEDSSYHDWLVNKDTNPARSFMRGIVQQFRTSGVAV